MASSAHSDSGSDSDNTWDDWDEGNQPARSLFEPAADFPTAWLALDHDRRTHGVDLPLIASTLDFFERIRLINWIRATNPDPASLRRLDRNAAFLDDDQYLKPVLEDDALLQVDFDTLSLDTPPSGARPSSSSAAPSSSNPPIPSIDEPLTPSDLIETLKAHLADAQAANEHLRRIVKERLGGEMGLGEGDRLGEVVEGMERVSVKGKEKEGGEAVHKDDDHYYESYQYNDIHEIMLKDRVRTLAYRYFILHPSNAARFKDKVVLDVGCGTGILSMFAAQAGAKKVYAVDASNVAFKAMRNVKANGFEGVIEVIKGKVEEINLPTKVDVIISEWMGYCLLYECMLDSVLYARDKYLSPSGLMVPSQTSILWSVYAGQGWYDDRVKFWDEVYGFEMKAMKEKIEDEAIIEVMDEGEVVSSEVSIADIFTQTATIASLSFTSPFSLPITRAPANIDSSALFTMYGFLAHFDTYFTSAPRLADSSKRASSVSESDGEVFFTTGAWSTPTHWKQTFFLLREPIQVRVGDKVEGQVKVGKNEDNSRELSVEVVWSVVNSKGEKRSEGVQAWKVR
ncbi:hypothetical protein Rt10032_c10g4330 [Rhodotorula toruloides]|uniref:type I protein arginine methyltransferase n=1 Tax=Rhodotorula toruloides TaxID=5286 RepID=A0A511KIU7_RHOTO|nr:hypothetical protein Rt10032_c10g4330 [Rhodotorula toruloides]